MPLSKVERDERIQRARFPLEFGPRKHRSVEILSFSVTTTSELINRGFFFTVCAFPYILAFTADSIEVRLVINGNLIQAMVMPRLTLITSKSDVFFATTAPEFFTATTANLRGGTGGGGGSGGVGGGGGIRGGGSADHKDTSPPSSPHCNLLILRGPCRK